MDTGNYIARLNEYAQRNRFSLTYEDGGSDGPDHNRIFRQRAVLNGKVYPDGLGKTKRDAKREAAKNALNDLGKGHQDSVDPTESAAEASVVPVHQTRTGDINYICWLNEYGQKNRVTIKPVESTRPGPNNVTQCCSFVVGDKEYPAATGKTKREAKEEAAKLVHHEICGSKTTENADGISNSAPIQEKADSVSDICTKTGRLSLSSSFTETNYIGIVNHYCQKTNSSLKFIEERCGPPHNRQFFYKVVINNKQYSEGEGNTVKEAKQNAAQLAWSALQEQSDWDSQVSVRSTASNDGARPTLSVQSSTQESYTSPSKSTSESTSDYIIFADSSNPSKAQMSSSFTASSDDASTRESSASSQSMPVAKSSSGICSASPNSTEDQHPIKDKNIGGRPNNTQTRFISEFEPMECLGSGGFGSVYKARHKLTAKVYAVKIVSWEEKSLREVKTLSDLQHPNIVRYYTVWMETSGYPCNSSQPASEKYLYIQMELCGTKTLRGWINEMNDQDPQDPRRREKSLSIAQAITNGVEYIHSEKHFHRDLKPDNILFGRDGTVKIGDFGLVTRDDDEFDLMDRTVGKGTPNYMAPEQKKEKKYGRKVDIFSMGLIFLELLWKVSTGHERINVLHDARRQMFPKDFSLTFPQEREIIKPMLCEKPEGRPEASELKKDLDKWAQIFNTQNQPNESVTV